MEEGLAIAVDEDASVLLDEWLVLVAVREHLRKEAILVLVERRNHDLGLMGAADVEFYNFSVRAAA